MKAVLQNAIFEAGKILTQAMHQPKKIRYKGQANLVTETDKLAEKIIIDIILKNFPNHSILAEESFGKEKYRAKSPYRWIVDPVDGTTNFAHGLPIAAVSIGFEDHGIMTLGGVWNPFLKEFFWAERKKGAFLNEKRIHVSKTSTLESALLVTGFPYDRAKRARHYLKIVEAFLSKSHGIRRLGSASLDMCYVACGRFDGYWESKLMPWDQAAGFLIAQEAGATCTDFHGKPFNIDKRETLVTNGRIHKAMIKKLAPFV